MPTESHLTALFREPDRARAAIDDLDSLGFPGHRVSLIAGSRAQDRVRRAMGGDDEVKSYGSNMPEGLAAGTGIGLTAGALVGGLTAVGALGATGGIGIVAAGPVVAALAGGSLGGVAGGTLGAALGSAVPEQDSQSIGEVLEEGGVLVDVVCRSDSERTMVEQAFRGKNANAIVQA